MFSGAGRQVSLKDIQLVQNLIERCIQLYMSKREVVDTLFHQAKIERCFIELVWNKLEEENKEFFRAYNIRLILKHQIVQFNQLLERQVELMHNMSHAVIPSTSQSNGFQIPSMEWNSAHTNPQPHIPCLKSENMSQYDCINGTYSTHQHMEAAASMSWHAGRMDFPAHMALHHSSNYAGNSPAMFGADNNLLEAHNAFREASTSSFNGGESCSQSFNQSVLETGMNSFEVDQMPQNYGVSEQIAVFSRTDMLQSYYGIPFMETDPNLLHTQQAGCILKTQLDKEQLHDQSISVITEHEDQIID